MSLIAVKPYSSIIRCACATMPAGSSASPQASGSAPGCAGPLVEQVGAERHRVAHLAAEQVGDRPADRVALDVQAGDLERGEHLVGGARRGDHARGAYRARRHRAAARAMSRANGVEREHVQPDDGLARPPRRRAKVRGVGVGLAEADQAGVGIELDDGAQRVRLVHADGVQQRRVDERHRGDARPGDANRLAGHQMHCFCGERVGEHRPPRRDDRAQFGDIVGRRHDQWRPHRARIDTLQRHAGFDQRHRVPGHRVAQPHERVEELAQQRRGQWFVAGFECLVERQRQVRARTRRSPTSTASRRSRGRPVVTPRRSAGR